jgi:hypothetical protein
MQHLFLFDDYHLVWKFSITERASDILLSGTRPTIKFAGPIPNLTGMSLTYV